MVILRYFSGIASARTPAAPAMAAAEAVGIATDEARQPVFASFDDHHGNSR